jgi:hypothetical protein
LRGTEIEIRGPTALRGRVLAVAREETTQDGVTTARHRLSLLAEGGVRSVILETVDGLALADPDLERRVELVLARLADNQRDQQREVRVAIGGTPGRTVRLGYLAEMPLWKASYRLVAGAGDGLLQGWAILENLSGQGWRDVEVTLIAGSPTALRQALFRSYFVPRPEVPVLPVPPEAPMAKALQAEMAAAPERARESMAADVAPRAASPAPAGLAIGTTEELTAQTLFRLPQPVSLPTGHTAMVPIVDGTVPVERVALYRAPAAGQHPKAALRLRNGTGASLPGGVVTLYEPLAEGGLTYLGDAFLPQLAPGAEELLAYGLDGNIEVTARQDGQGRLDRVRIADGVLELARVEQQRSAYHVTSRFGGAPRSFVLEQELPPGWRVAEPADAAIRGDKLRLTRSLPPEAELDLAVVLEQPVVETIGLLDAEPDSLLLAFQGLTPPPEVRTAIERLRSFSARLADLDREAQAIQARRDERVAEQERLRDNLGAVPPDSDLARRFLERLATSEDELADLARRQEELRVARERAVAERLAYVRSLRL